MEPPTPGIRNRELEHHHLRVEIGDLVISTSALEDSMQPLQVIQKSAVKIKVIPLQDLPCSLEEEAFLVSFKSVKNDRSKHFQLMPASKTELAQLALFLGTCTYFHTAVTHEIVPGQRITSVPTIDGKVEITLSTDVDLINLLADPEINQSLTVILDVEQLESFEEFITNSITFNEVLNSFSPRTLKVPRQFQVAS